MFVLFEAKLSFIREDAVLADTVGMYFDELRKKYAETND